MPLRETWPKRGRTLAPLLVLAALLLTGPDAGAAAFEFKDATWEGSSELLALARQRLGRDRVRVVAVIPWDELEPVDALLVVHPEREVDYREAAAFLAAGGRLGMADDFGKGDALLERFRIHRIRAPLSPKEALRENPNLPVAVPAVPRDARPHPVVDGIDRVVTNHPTGLQTDLGLELTPVLEMQALGEDPVALALIGVIGDAKRCGLVSDVPDVTPQPAGATPPGRCGRLLALGDPSVLINLMLRYPGNRKFAERLVEYLVGDDTWGKRSGKLYVVANDFGQKGTFGRRGGLASAIEDWLEALARLVDGTRREGLPPGLALFLAVAAGLAAVVWAATVATRRYRRATPRYARPTPLVAQGGLAGRAAVLGADTTHRALAVLELKAALEEALRDRLGLDPAASPRKIVEEINGRDALSRRNSSALDELFGEMAQAETAVASTERLRVTPATVRKMHDKMTAILTELDERIGNRP